MIYAELYDDISIKTKGVFLTMDEFLPYRKQGWSGTADTNAAADKLLALRETPENVLRYMAPMIRTGQDARDELARRDTDKERKE